MAKEKRLATSDAVPTIMKRLFPSKGVFDEAEFQKVVNVNDRNKVYKDASEGRTQLTPADTAKMLNVFVDAMTLTAKAIGDTKGLEQVFGKENVAAAQVTYFKAQLAMLLAMVTMKDSLSTDYNRDDEEVGLGGWASFDGGHVHLARKVAAVTDKAA